MNNKYPKVMMVSDDPITKDNPGRQRVIWAYNSKFSYPYFAYSASIKTLKNVEDIPDGEGGVLGLPVGWRYAQEPQQTELTLDEIADKFGISVNHLKIKK